jgi:hypothetical protein
VPARVAQVLDQMLQPRPSDRFESATAAAEALEAAVRPRTPAPASQASRKGPTAGVGDTAPIPAQALVSRSPAPTRMVAARVTYPSWFRPLANLAETAPVAALAAMAAVVMLAFAAGFGTALIVGR